MRHYNFRLLNVFASSTLGGNPLAVFENGTGLTTEEMQALALQFNLSETTFIFPPAGATDPDATAAVRIFSPSFEMPFAGHPTLGTAQVVRDLYAAGDAINLRMPAGLIPVTAQGNAWTLCANAPVHAPAAASRAQIAAALHLEPQDIVADPLWINTGSDQLVVMLGSVEAVHRAAPDAELMVRHCSNDERAMVYVVARDGAVRDGVQHAQVRFFFPKNGVPCEDPGTGSACANLGGYLCVTGAPLPQRWHLEQGAAVKRPCHLHLQVDAEGEIFVSGQVVELGRGVIDLPETA